MENHHFKVEKKDSVMEGWILLKRRSDLIRIFLLRLYAASQVSAIIDYYRHCPWRGFLSNCKARYFTWYWQAIQLIRSYEIMMKTYSLSAETNLVATSLAAYRGDPYSEFWQMYRKSSFLGHFLCRKVITSHTKTWEPFPATSSLADQKVEASNGSSLLNFRPRSTTIHDDWWWMTFLLIH